VKRQTRRSISLSAAGYERLRALAGSQGTPMAAVLEAWIESAAAASGIHVDPEAARARANEILTRRQQVRADRLAKMQREAFGP
jgi:hypothetical protein